MAMAGVKGRLARGASSAAVGGGGGGWRGRGWPWEQATAAATTTTTKRRFIDEQSLQTVFHFRAWPGNVSLPLLRANSVRFPPAAPRGIVRGAARPDLRWHCDRRRARRNTYP